MNFYVLLLGFIDELSTACRQLTDSVHWRN